MPPDVATPNATSTAPATPQAPAPTTPAPAAKPAVPDKAAQRERWREASRNVLGKAANTPPAPAAAPEAPTPQAQKTVDRIEQAGGDAPEQRVGESDKNYEARLARTLVDLQRAQAEATTHRKRADTAEGRASTAETRVKDLERILEEAKDPVKALRLAGETPESVARMMMEGKLKKSPYADLPPEVAKRLEELERKETERDAQAKREKEEREAAEAQAQARAADLAHIDANMADYRARFPLASSAPKANERILDHLYARQRVAGDAFDVDKELGALEAALSSDLEALLSNEASVKALCSRPGVRDTLSKVLAGSPIREQSTQATPASEDRGKHTVEDGPRSLTQSVVSEVPAPITPANDPREQKDRIRKAGRAVLAGLR